MKTVTAYAPASISNLACGFDVLGLALEAPGDRVTARRVAGPGVRVGTIEGDGGALPREPQKNTATVAARALLETVGEEGVGLELSLVKGLPLSSGLGGSAASAVAAVVAVDRLLGLGLPRPALLEAALRGEAIASGARHADNVAPCLLGGFVLVRSVEPVDVVPLPAPEELAFALLHPQVEVATRAARGLLPEALPLPTAVAQWANLGAFVAALHQGDWELLGRSMVDRVAEPARRHLVPGYDEVTEAAKGAGAVGANLSGSGPTIYALCRGRQMAEAVARAMAEAFGLATGLRCRSWASGVSAEGARVEAEEG